jgi:hypothetical protein
VSLETDLVTVLKTACARVRPDEGNLNEARPFVTYQHIGGDPLRYLDGSAAAQRHAQLQVDVYADTAEQAIALMLAVETALCGAATLIASPVGALRSSDVEGMALRRCLQEFSVLGVR